MKRVTSTGIVARSKGGYVISVVGVAEYVKFFKPNYERLSWREVCDAFHELYPDRWAVQVFPPKSQLVDGKNVYHLFVLPHSPDGMNIKQGM